MKTSLAMLRSKGEVWIFALETKSVPGHSHSLTHLTHFECLLCSRLQTRSCHCHCPREQGMTLTVNGGMHTLRTV